jgi:hypothetical protein
MRYNRQPSPFNRRLKISDTRKQMTRVLALFAFTTLQVTAQVLPATKLSDLPAGFTQTVVKTFSQTCSYVAPPLATACTNVAGNPATPYIVSAGNQFDGQGNLYFSYQNAIRRMTPEGQISFFANAPAVNTCTQPTPSTAVFTSTVIGTFAFNLAANSLYVYSGNTVTTWASAVGTCNSDGSFSGTLSNGTSESTTAVIRVQGF